MKIIIVNRPIDQQQFDTFPKVDIIPDSAIIKEGKPFFVPNFSSSWKYEITIVFRIIRLGKNIAVKFANRYYDAIAIAARTIPVDIRSTESALSTVFDGSFILGDWINLDQIQQDKDLSIKISNNNFTLNLSHLAIDETIAQLSKYLTLKIGDIIAPATIPIIGDIKINTIIEGQLNDNLNIKLKFK